MKIEEYLNSLEKKEMMYILFSIPIAIFIVYYNFIYPNLEKKTKTLEKLEKKTQKNLYVVATKIRKVKGSKNVLVPTREKLEKLREENRYVSYNFDTLDFIRLNNKKIYNILTGLLNKAKNLSLLTSFEVEWNKKSLPPFTQYIAVKITGHGNYKAIIKYLQYIDHIRSLLSVGDVKIATSLNQNSQITANLKKVKEASSNSFSFILTKYSENTIIYLKNLAKTKHLDISMSVNSYNPSYLNVSFKGNYANIINTMNILKATQKVKNKLFVFTELKAHLKFVNKVKDKTKQQQFMILLEMVGIK